MHLVQQLQQFAGFYIGSYFANAGALCGIIVDNTIAVYLNS